MNKTLKTSVVAIALAGGGAIGVGTLASASYGGEDPTTETPETPDDTTDDTADDAVPQGLQAAPDDGTGDLPEGEGEGRGPRGRHGAKHAEAIAEAIGVTPEQLQESRQAGQSVADVAAAQGVDIAVVEAAILSDIEEHLAEEVAEGELTQEEADEKLAGAAERVTESVNRVPGEGGERGPRGQRGFRNSETVTETLGLTADELQEARAAGQSLADVATAQGVDVDTLVQAIVDDVEEHLAEHVVEGELTQEEADEKLAGAEERVTERVNTAPGEGDGERGPRGPRGPGGGDAPADDAGAGA